jgi:hypothetical protein
VVTGGTREGTTKVSATQGQGEEKGKVIISKADEGDTKNKTVSPKINNDGKGCEKRRGKEAKYKERTNARCQTAFHHLSHHKTTEKSTIHNLQTTKHKAQSTKPPFKETTVRPLPPQPPQSHNHN